MGQSGGSSGGGTGGGAGGGKLVTVLTAVNLLATVGIVAVLFISFQRDKKAATISDIAPHGEDSAAKSAVIAGAAGSKASGEFGKMVTLDQFTVNLSTPGSVNPKYVRVSISLSVPNGDTESEVTAKMPQVRNAIIDLFNSKRPADLSNAEGRDYLKEEIRNALNGFLVNGKITGVFFTSFAVSS